MFLKLAIAGAIIFIITNRPIMYIIDQLTPFLSRPPPSPSPPTPQPPIYHDPPLTDPEPFHEETTIITRRLYRRSFFTRAQTTTVLGYPRTGGIYALSCDGVMLEFLGVDRFKRTFTERKNDEEEDAFCAKMRMLGARRWGCEVDWELSLMDLDRDVLVVGWSEGGGVWVLRIGGWRARREGLGCMLRNALSMQERCGVIVRLGGVFYEEPRECKDLEWE
ncbi:uncharacterized protein BO80DRAFT_193815 [Aspergillus ibericus CBS 121593]|uniref:Uncharacterized protein n=1 Tax=Aspergillus ibericus CBS 121593 TaxID=1448316 RepID=A0A395GP96_9EURO|nr:hypothetical protein BO80DRAFT_193815 [Aspergillus ibericus CBS 121593]RAK97299.1 hypothetical protein BO80DRAFT_193815 [Aspergillus ibericus CBS 121593]